MSSIFNFFYLYDPWLFHFFRMSFFIGFIAILILTYQIYQVYQKSLKQSIVIPIDSVIILAIFIVLSIIPAVAHRTFDFSVFGMYIKSLLLFILGIALYNLCYREPNSQFKLMKDIKIGISIQAIIGFLALCGTPFIIDLSLSTNVILPRFYGSEQEYRLYNITSSAFFQLSLFYVILLHFILAYNAKHNNINTAYLFLLLFIGLISGRTFLLLSFISLVFYFKWRYLSTILIFLAFCLFLAINFPEHKYVAHALEPIINLLAIKTDSTMTEVTTISSSTDTLMRKHLFIPELKQILIGDGRYFAVGGGYYEDTDSGFLRQLLYGGISYLILCFMLTAYFVKRISDNWFDGSWKFILSTLFLLSIMHIKADTYAFPGIMFILLMFLSLFGEKGKSKSFVFHTK